MPFTSVFLDISEKIASAVQERIRELVGTNDAGKILYIGADGTPTKLIDDVSENVIFEILEKEQMNFRIISEEAGERLTGKKPEYVLIIDPIDGTYNACSGIPFYSLSIAVATIENDAVFFGYVKNLATGDTFYAETGKGSYLNGSRIGTSINNDLSSFCMSIYGYRDNIRGAATLARSVRRIREFGSVALELCYVASGMIDAFADVRGTMRMTDVAAGKLIIEEAGGIITNEYGEALKLEDKIMSRVSVIASNGYSHEMILKLSAGIVNEGQ